MPFCWIFGLKFIAAQEEVAMLLDKAFKRRKGFGIVEVLISAVVLGFLYLALMDLQLGNRRALLRIRGRDAAVEVAQLVLDSLQSVGASGIVAKFGSDTTFKGPDYVRTWDGQGAKVQRVSSSDGSTPSTTVSYNSKASKIQSRLVYNTEIKVKPDVAYVAKNKTGLDTISQVYAKNVVVKVSWPFNGSTQSVEISGVIR